MKFIYFFLLLLISFSLSAQELFIYTEPASNMPAKSIAVKQSAKFFDQGATSSTRHATEFMIGASKNLMLHGSATYGALNNTPFGLESIRAYGKYRFFSADGMYSHFRMAAFAEIAHSNTKPMYQEINLQGDQSGVQAGLVFTQLLHKLAVSSTVSYASINGDSKAHQLKMGNKASAINYSLSFGHLIFPKKYTSYDQTNFNIYAELLGQVIPGTGKSYLDLAPSMQLIFNSKLKLNLAYRYNLQSSMTRMAQTSWMLGGEWLFLNALKSKNK
jgi:hypothetical protein